MVSDDQSKIASAVCSLQLPDHDALFQLIALVVFNYKVGLLISVTTNS